MRTPLLEEYIDSLYTLLEQEETPGEPQEQPQGNTLTKEQLRYVLKNSKGKIMTIVYRKKNGATRILNTRTGVKKNIKGTGLKYDPEMYGYLILWDLQKNNYRTVNPNTATKLSSQGKTYTITEAVEKKPLRFKSGILIDAQGEAAWNYWKRALDRSRTQEYLYKVLETIKRQNYMATPNQQAVLDRWFNS